MSTVLESLTALAERLSAERRRAVDELTSVPVEASIPNDLLARVGHLHAAWLAVQAEIESHTPSVGYGTEV
ncbi:MAG: hypothetical protein QOK29_1347 [Rhodospirillaceae bacterium]|jgi:hypothetical protein|nr:hypothetical protein [Rhodospirillaceae bacterium]